MSLTAYTVKDIETVLFLFTYPLHREVEPVPERVGNIVMLCYAFPSPSNNSNGSLPHINSKIN